MPSEDQCVDLQGIGLFVFRTFSLELEITVHMEYIT